MIAREDTATEKAITAVAFVSLRVATLLSRSVDQNRHMSTIDAIMAKNESKAKPKVAMLPDSVEVKNPNVDTTTFVKSVTKARFRAKVKSFL